MTRAVWIEVALNGPWGKRRQPGIPASVEDIVAEGIACAEAGACIIHTHAYEAGRHEQVFDWQTYARIIEGIRAKVDVPVYPSIPGTGTGVGTGGTPLAASERFAHFVELANRGLLEFAVVDPGSVNFTEHQSAAGGGSPGRVYLNPEEHICHGLDIAARYGFHPAYAIYEPGFTRAGAALARARAKVKIPVYRFMFSDLYAWGFPPTTYGLHAHTRLLADCDPAAPWMIAGLGVDVRPLIAETVHRGGHVRVGLEDAPLGSTMSNLAWLEEAVRLVRAAGAEPATTTEMREELKAITRA
jgi:uncharacterized protein (DUF849 family)